MKEFVTPYPGRINHHTRGDNVPYLADCSGVKIVFHLRAIGKVRDIVLPGYGGLPYPGRMRIGGTE